MSRQPQHNVALLARRLKAARRRRGISQMRLGIEAGVDESSASARLNQYERGKHMPDFVMVRHLARALDVPAAYFYAESDEEAQLLMGFHVLPGRERKRVLRLVQELSNKERVALAPSLPRRRK